MFGARFDNELLGGTLKADTSTALQALHDILNNGGAVSAADAAKLVAAGDGYVGDATDVSGNNIPNGGGTYVGTSTTVQGATTTQIADANTTTSGNVDGNEQPTGHPVNGLTNKGFGVTDPAPSSGAGTGAGGGAGGAGAGGGAGGGNDHQNHSGGHGNPAPAGSSTIASDIAALTQAMQHGDAGAFKNAIATLGTDVQSNSGGAAAMVGSLTHESGGGVPDVAAAHAQQFEHMWG